MNQEDSRTTKDDFLKKSIPAFLIFGILFGLGILGVWLTPEIKKIEKPPETTGVPHVENTPHSQESEGVPPPETFPTSEVALEPEIPPSPKVPLAPPPVQNISTPFTQFGSFVSLTSSVFLRVRQTSGLFMNYTVGPDTRYYRCDIEISSGDLVPEQSVIVEYTLSGGNIRKVVAVYLVEGCGADTVPASFARERYLSHFGSEYLRIVSGTVQKKEGSRFDVVQTNSEFFSFSYGVDTVLYRCGSPYEFTLVNGQKVSVSFVPGLEARGNIIYTGGVDLRDDC